MPRDSLTWKSCLTPAKRMYSSRSSFRAMCLLSCLQSYGALNKRQVSTTFQMAVILLKQQN